MKATGRRDVVSVNKTFTITVKRAYNKPYQNLLIEAMPPANDRALIASLLNNQEIFRPEYIYRPDDPYFGKATRVVYQHAFGLAPDTLETYVSSLYENHYWKNLVLGEIATAQAINPDTGEVVYEVVYSKIIDDLVNSAGESVSKIVNLPYAIVNPVDSNAELTQVYPNSLINMRDQVIDVVGQISSKLPLWMTSKQANGRVLGFTPAWVMCYTKPGRGEQIAYYVQTLFEGQLNSVDFKVDRYVLDAALSKNWDTATQNWTPEPSLTTFDFVPHYEILGLTVDNDGSSLEYRQITYLPPGTGGTGYAIGNKILVLGSQVGGVDGVNDITVLVLDVDAGGAITVVNASGEAVITQIVGTEFNTITGTNVIGTGVGATFDFIVSDSPDSVDTTFDGAGMQFTAPVDMYNPSDRNDKYLVFPKANILV
jgi:hypothetical protein